MHISSTIRVCCILRILKKILFILDDMGEPIAQIRVIASKG